MRWRTVTGKGYGNPVRVLAIRGVSMAGASNPATHFGRQMRKERLARGWSLQELGQRTGYDTGHLSRVENGRRPPTGVLATACDAVFPERRGWFTEYYEESRAWAEIPPGFRSWAEIEDKASSLQDWYPSIVTGLLQTDDYARALLATYPGATSETVTSRLRARMERQRRVLMRDKPPAAWFVVDEMALYRLVGSARIMEAQMRQLSAVASLPNIRMQVLPAVAHPANASGLMIAGDAAYAEHLAGGYVFTDEETVSALVERFDSLRTESYRASESAALIDGTCKLWATGISPLTQTPTEASVWRSRRTT